MLVRIKRRLMLACKPMLVWHMVWINAIPLSTVKSKPKSKSKVVVWRSIPLTRPYTLVIFFTAIESLRVFHMLRLSLRHAQKAERWWLDGWLLIIIERCLQFREVRTTLRIWVAISPSKKILLNSLISHLIFSLRWVGKPKQQAQKILNLNSFSIWVINKKFTQTSWPHTQTPRSDCLESRMSCRRGSVFTFWARVDGFGSASGRKAV